MKRTVKIIALCLALMAFTALFAGCDALDEMKANHAILSDDRETLSFNGEIYKKLPEGANLYYSSYYGNAFNRITVTNEDVPVLLSNTYCHSSQYDATRDIFRVYIFEEPEHYSKDFFYSYVYTTDEADKVFYCNEKDYDRYVNVIESGVMDHIGFEYETETEYFYYYYKLDIASQEASNEILGYIKNPEKLTSKVHEEIAENYDSECLQCNLYKCDSEGLLAEPLDGYDILRYPEGDAYLVNYLTETAVKLSDKTAEALEDKYFYGDYQFTDYYEDDGSVAIIGGADGKTDMVVIG